MSGETVVSEHGASVEVCKKAERETIDVRCAEPRAIPIEDRSAISARLRGDELIGMPQSYWARGIHREAVEKPHGLFCQLRIL